MTSKSNYLTRKLRNILWAVINPATEDNQTNWSQKVQIVDWTTWMIAQVIDDWAMRVINQTYLEAIAESYIPWHEIFSKVWYSPASTTARTTLWNLWTNYVFPSIWSQWEIVSTSINDTALWTWARTMHIKYLDTLYVEHIITVTLNWLTPVLTVPTNCFRVNTFHIETVGSLWNAAWTITLRTIWWWTIYSQIAPTNARARNSVYTVPAGKTLYIKDALLSAAANSAGKAVRLTIHATISPDWLVSTDWLLFFPYFEPMVIDNAVPYNKSSPMVFPEKTDIKVSVIWEAWAQCTSEISGWLEFNI